MANWWDPQLLGYQLQQRQNDKVANQQNFDSNIQELQQDGAANR